jgi:hypothetical protein
MVFTDMARSRSAGRRTGYPVASNDRNTAILERQPLTVFRTELDPDLTGVLRNGSRA